MLFFLRAWRLRPQRTAVEVEVDDLIFLYGANAYEEARRRRAQANDLSAMRHWSAVKSEIGRRILEVCADPGDIDRLGSKLTGAHACALWGPPAESRAEARRLAETIDSAGSDAKTGAGERNRPSLQRAASRARNAPGARAATMLLTPPGVRVPA